MKKLGLATIAASGLAAAILGLAAPAGAAPTGPGNAQETITELRADGYNVIVNRVGTTRSNKPPSWPSGRARHTHVPTPATRATASPPPSPARRSTSTSGNPTQRSKGHPKRVPLLRG